MQNRHLMEKIVLLQHLKRNNHIKENKSKPFETSNVMKITNKGMQDKKIKPQFPNAGPTVAQTHQRKHTPVRC